VLHNGGDAAALAAHQRQSMDGPLTSPARLNYLGSLIREWYESSDACGPISGRCVGSQDCCSRQMGGVYVPDALAAQMDDEQRRRQPVLSRRLA
jgi:hypothetical protein